MRRFSYLLFSIYSLKCWQYIETPPPNRPRKYFTKYQGTQNTQSSWHIKWAIMALQIFLLPSSFNALRQVTAVITVNTQFCFWGLYIYFSNITNNSQYSQYESLFKHFINIISSTPQQISEVSTVIIKFVMHLKYASSRIQTTLLVLLLLHQVFQHPREAQLVESEHILLTSCPVTPRGE